MVLITDSKTVEGWLQAVVHKTHNVKTRALSEVLIRRCLDTEREIIKQECLDIEIQRVKSATNLADRLTRVPDSWWRACKSSAALDAATMAAARSMNSSAARLPDAAATASAATTSADKPSLQDIRAIHDRNHFGVDRTLALAKEKYVSCVSKKMVKRVVSRCERCARIDPAMTFR